MNWQRIALLLRFDLYYSLTRLKGWIFLMPFFLCWFVIFKQINKGVSGMLQSQEGIMITSAIYGTDGALNLFIEHPPSVSLCYLISLSTIPFFVVLAAYDQFSSDLGSGFFRFLIARCKRMEIFLARFLSAYSLIAAAFLIVIGIGAALSIKNDGYPAADVLLYSAQIYLSLLLYTLPFIAYMSLISSLVSSTLAALFLGMFGYAAIWFLNLFTYFTEQKDVFTYLLANSLKEYLFELDNSDFFIALAILPIYTLVYAALAFRVFNRRNL
jgi:ABC-2 type transport system permease protein